MPFHVKNILSYTILTFFQKAALNVRDNVGEEVDAEQLIQEACRSCLEQFPDEETTAQNKQELEQLRTLSASGDFTLQVTAPFGTVGPICLPASRGVLSRNDIKSKNVCVPKIEVNLFISGITNCSKSAMSIGGNEESTLEGTEPRGKRERSTSKGQKEARVAGFQRVERMILGEVGKPFQYAADPQDKHWLAEQHHMRATGGKMAYLLIEEDIRDLAASDDYRGCLDLKLEELKSFVLPSWMVEKMRKYMETLRTENEHRAVEALPQT
ncbi:deoxynucleotidyltransferase terminal-interacting protein 1-like [Leptonychotes weddellii]|uniref:Deoxynucleotidyltransferase terminal-interacting protein 1 n=1 Tax=Leptonychotes weddellii TaxID=9713 RepID=A0A7F8QYT2_LEPWE|nr:deoxynucleotidyltransferase terminal-interacting protein 1-like [Leptonychotes weddellii]